MVDQRVGELVSARSVLVHAVLVHAAVHSGVVVDLTRMFPP